MKRVKSFNEFINEAEAEFKLNNPAGGASELAKIIRQNSIGTVETGDNSGTVVNKFQKSVGISDGQPWCMAFIFYIFSEFSKKMGITNPVYKTGSVLEEWDKTQGKKITAEQAKSDFSLVKPGQIMIATRKGGGHGGIVTKVDYNGKKFTTVEGNVGITGKKQGVGQYNRSILTTGLIGFIDYFPNRTPEFDKSFADALGMGDVSGNSVVRDLPGDDIIGGNDATSSGEDKSSSKSGGIFGKIISGVTRFYGDGKGNYADNVSTPTDKEAIDALAPFAK